MTEAAENTRKTGQRGRRKLTRSVVVCVLAAIALGVGVGFVDFADRIAGAAPPADPRAEGIVVLTGGSARIDEALQLLAEGRATRLLISGVNPAVTRESIAATVGGSLKDVLACCVDLDHRARDTVGNAAEARDWAQRQGFSSLIVVTSDYHMPRSMAELALAMPDKELIAFPVSNPDLHLARWWRDRETLGLLLREYGKFLLAEARRMLAPVRPANAAERG